MRREATIENAEFLLRRMHVVNILVLVTSRAMFVTSTSILQHADVMFLSGAVQVMLFSSGGIYQAV